MNDTLIVVMAHAAVQDTVDRHMPYWQKLGDVLVTCPPDSMVRSEFPVLAIGENRHNGPSVNNKFRQIISFMTCMDYQWYQFTEYDGITLPKDRPHVYLDLDCGYLHANAFVNNGQKEFEGRQYFHPPLTMDWSALLNFRDAISFVRDDEERGFWDRLAGLACDRHPLSKWQGYGPLGFARNTIEPHMIPEAVAARKAGAIFFHGVKSEQALVAILNA